MSMLQRLCHSSRHDSHKHNHGHHTIINIMRSQGSSTPRSCSFPHYLYVIYRLSTLRKKISQGSSSSRFFPHYLYAIYIIYKLSSSTIREAVVSKKCSFFNIVQTGGGQPMFKNYVGNCRVFWRSFNNMKFA